MIDISHSMILYGEDRITPAKKVAMALAELITKKYPKDTLDVLVFGDDAWQIEIKDLPYLKVGPYHTNTVAGLELAFGRFYDWIVLAWFHFVHPRGVSRSPLRLPPEYPYGVEEKISV